MEDDNSYKLTPGEKHQIEEEQRLYSQKNKDNVPLKRKIDREPLKVTLMLIFGIILPIGAFLTNLCLIPFPISFYSPDLYIALLIGFTGIGLTALKLNSTSGPMAFFCAIATFLAIVYSSLFSIIFIPLIPISLIAIILYGLGIVGFSPFFSLWAAITAFRRSFNTASEYYRKSTIIMTCIICTIILPIIYISIRTSFDYVTRRNIYIAVHCTEEEKNSVYRQLIANPTTPSQLLNYYTYHDDTPYEVLADILLSYDLSNKDEDYSSNFFPSIDRLLNQQPVDSQEAATLYYLLYGQTINTAEKEKLKKIRLGYWNARYFEDYSEDDEAWWSSLSLTNCQYDGVINLDAMTSYQEVTMNVSSEYDNREMVCEFKVPPGSVVTKLSLWINGQEQIAAIAPKEKAKEVYESIVSKKRDPAIVTWLGGDRYELRVFPVNKNLPRKVRIGISGPLYSGDKNVVFLPVTFLSRNFKIDKNTVTGAIIDISSKEDNFKVTGLSDNFKIMPGGKNIKRVKARINGFTPEDLEFCVDIKNKEKVLTCESKNYRYYQVSIYEDINKKDRRPLSITYLLDSTYPMKRDKMFDGAKKAIETSISNLKEGDRFNIIGANYEIKRLFPEPETVNEETITKAKDFLKNLEASGGMDLTQVINSSFFPADYDIHPVFIGIIHSTHPIITDGFSSLEESGRLIEPISAGLLLVDYRENEFLSDLINNAGGETFRVKEPGNLDFAFSKIESYALDNNTKNITCTCSNSSVSPVPSGEVKLFSTKPNFFYIRIPKEIKDPGTVTITEVDSKKVIKTFNLKNDVKETSQDHIARLWAYNYITAEQKKELKNQLSDKEFNSLVKLAKDYYMVTPYTAFIVLESQEQYKRFGIDKNYKGEIEAPSIPEPETIFMIILLLLFCGIIYLKYRKNIAIKPLV